MGRLQDKVAVVTGGASGIGAGTVHRFLDEGARVVIADLQIERGRALQAELGDRTAFAEVDVTNEDQVAEAVDLAVERFGRLDVMFNNAGIVGAIGPIADTPGEAWRETIDILLHGVFYGIKHAARVMVPQGSGAIVSTSSTAGVMGGLGPHAYTAAKHAVVGLTKSAASELAPHGIRVNAVAPGNTVTAMTAAVLTGDPDALDAAAEAMTATSPLARAGQPVDIANAVLFLASDEAAYVTGHTLVADAGQTTGGTPARFATTRTAMIREAGRR